MPAFLPAATNEHPHPAGYERAGHGDHEPSLMRFRRRRPAPAPVQPPPRAAKPTPVAAPPDFSDLEAQARYHRDRLGLYRARMHGAHETSVERLRELERTSAAADERLKTARRTGHL